MMYAMRLTTLLAVAALLVVATPASATRPIPTKFRAELTPGGSVLVPLPSDTTLVTLPFRGHELRAVPLDRTAVAWRFPRELPLGHYAARVFWACGGLFLAPGMGTCAALRSYVARFTATGDGGHLHRLGIPG